MFFYIDWVEGDVRGSCAFKASSLSAAKASFQRTYRFRQILAISR